MLFPPSQRWVRYLHWMGVEALTIAQECASSLMLPGFMYSAEEVVAAILSDSPGSPRKQHLRVYQGGKTKKAKKPKRKSKKSTSSYDWVVAARNMEPDQDEYAAHWGLPYYCDSTPGIQTIKNAVGIWMTSTLREIACASILANHTFRETSALLRKQGPRISKNVLRPRDVETFRDMFWDFRGVSIGDRAQWLRSHPSTHYAARALSEGYEPAMQRLGLSRIDTSEDKIREDVRAVLAGWLAAQKANPELVSVFQVESAWRTFKSTYEDEGLVTTKAPGASDAAGTPGLPAVGSERLAMLQPAPLPHYSDLVAETGKRQRLEDVDTALQLNVIDLETAEDYRHRIRNGEEIGTVLRDAITEAQSMEEDVDAL